MSHSIIVGAGIFGVTAALELRRRRHAVTLLDPGPIPHPDAASTDISKVLRMDYGADEFYMELMAHAFTGWDAWNDRWGEPLYHQTGVLMLSRGAMQPGGYEYESYRLLLKRGHAVERMDSNLIRRRFPAWNASLYPDGYFNPRGGWAASGRVVEKLVTEARALGVDVRPGERISRWVARGARVVGVETQGGLQIHGDHVVLAAGSWTPHLHPGLAGLMWSTAQDVFHFRVPVPAEFQPPVFPVWTADIANTGWYGFPALPDGTLKVAHHGQGRQTHPSHPRQVLDDSEARYRTFLRQTFPALAGAPRIHARVCFYADTFDGDFLIDHDPERPGLVVASGGSGHGFKFAPMLGGIIADVVERQPNPVAGRFAWRTPAARRTEDARFEGSL
jgi:glycine/D-amino acid oxidase-like deaminating enzyme